VETGSDEILAGADKADIAFLVVGDPFGYVATHSEALPYAIKLFTPKGLHVGVY
jgi:diphthine synthase